jgi:AcrR family transcriptional regulator
LLQVALTTLEKSGPQALQARKLTAEVGASTQAVYTHFGGMPGIFDALVVDGFVRFGQHVAAVPQTDDPVADFFSQGWAFCDWALAHPQLYRLMFGLAGHLRVALRLTETGALANFPEGQAAAEVMVRAIDRIKAAGRIEPIDSLLAAGQVLSATHGWVLLEIAGTFGGDERGQMVMGLIGVNLMVGLGDSREAAQRSLQAAVEARAAGSNSSMT